METQTNSNSETCEMKKESFDKSILDIKAKEFSELYETIEMMKSTDYNERFMAEFYQLKIRITKLDSFLSFKVSRRNVTV